MANRSRKKPFFVSYSLIKAVNKARASGKNPRIKTRSRASTIYPDFVGLTIEVYNGKIYIPVTVDEQKVGRKLGEFSLQESTLKKLYQKIQQLKEGRLVLKN